MRSIWRRATVRIVAPLVGIALLASACGDNDAPDAQRDAAATPSITVARDTPTAGATPTAVCCPRELTLEIDGPAVDLDLGSTGINYDTHFPNGFAIRLAADCPHAAATGCGVCALTDAAPEDRRCFADMSRHCARDADCESRKCVRLFSPPLPLNAGGVPSCAIDEVASMGTGSFDPATGAIELPLTLHWNFYEGVDVGFQCPRCSGAAIGDTGTCRAGLNDGAACTVHATDVTFGNTSYDCPPEPGADAGALDIPMMLTSGISTLTADQVCTGPPFTGHPCYCEGQVAANVCDQGRCLDESDGDSECDIGPDDGSCAIETFLGCRSDSECRAAGDHCVFRRRECLGVATADLGIVAPLVRRGRVDGTSALLVAAFCVQPATTALGNAALGLPAAASMRLPVRVTQTTMCSGSMEGATMSDGR
jgi:hypothetical protein